MSASRDVQGEDRLDRDRRKEWWLVPQALLALVVVAALVIVRELVLR